MKIVNPLLPGFHPDPSVCRVGHDYFLVTSSFEYFPGVPLFHSRDLVHWRPIGHCLTRKSQLPLDRAAPSQGIFAPTLRFHNGRFYMVTTNVSDKGNFLVSAADPSGEWSDPVWLDQPGIDPSLFFDASGAVYLTSAGEDGILQSRIDIATGQRRTPLRTIWRGTGGRYPEGPHLYKIDGRYYLMIAEGGTEYGHMETVARAGSPWGPFEPCPDNPLLTHRHRGRHPIQATGHGDLVQSPDGSWWMVFLGIRPVDEHYHHLGRETFLAPVVWTKNGWPRVTTGGTVEMTMDGPAGPPCRWPREPERDDFDSPRRRLCWNFLRNPDEKSWSLTDRPGWLRLTGSGTTLDEAASPSFIGRRQQHFFCEVAARMDYAPRSPREEAGLTAYMNERHHYDIAVTHRGGRRCVLLRERIGDLRAVVSEKTAGAGPLTLRLHASPREYRFSFDAGRRRNVLLGTAPTRYLSKEVAGGFTGVYFGLYAAGRGRPAFFDWFDYRPRRGSAGVI